MADVEVELQGGVKVKLPEEQAAAYAEARKKDKAEREELAKVAGAAKAEKEQEAQRRAQIEAEKAAIEAAKNGEIEKAKELLTKQTNEKVGKLAERYRDTHLRSQVASLPGLLKLPDAGAQKALVDDVVAQLRGGCRFDMDSDTLQVIGQDGRPALAADGKPLQVDAWIGSFLEARPYLRQPTTAPGSGAAGSGGGKGGAASITKAALDAMPPKAAGEFFAANPGAKVVG